MLAMGKMEKNMFRKIKILLPLNIDLSFLAMQRALFKNPVFVTSVSYPSPAREAEASYYIYIHEINSASYLCFLVKITVFLNLLKLLQIDIHILREKEREVICTNSGCKCVSFLLLNNKLSQS